MAVSSSFCVINHAASKPSRAKKQRPPSRPQSRLLAPTRQTPTTSPPCFAPSPAPTPATARYSSDRNPGPAQGDLHVVRGWLGRAVALLPGALQDSGLTLPGPLRKALDKLGAATKQTGAQPSRLPTPACEAGQSPERSPRTTRSWQWALTRPGQLRANATGTGHPARNRSRLRAQSEHVHLVRGSMITSTSAAAPGSHPTAPGFRTSYPPLHKHQAHHDCRPRNCPPRALQPTGIRLVTPRPSARPPSRHRPQPLLWGVITCGAWLLLCSPALQRASPPRPGLPMPGLHIALPKDSIAQALDSRPAGRSSPCGVSIDRGDRPPPRKGWGGFKAAPHSQFDSLATAPYPGDPTSELFLQRERKAQAGRLARPHGPRRPGC